MKKKLLLGLMLICVGFSCLACGTTTKGLVMDNMSEMTKVYYFGENEDFYCSLSSGQREKEYSMDGKHRGEENFALLSLNLSESISSQLVKATVIIDGQSSEVELEINSISSAYLVDLERELSGSETIEVVYDGQSLILENLSKDFAVNYQQALDIACSEMEDKIVEKRSFNNLNAECYLRVLDKKANDFDNVFWCFSVLNCDNENYSIIISTVDGSVLAKSE